ncbi:MAG TPA: excinuclease ABC subunit UvrB [Chitinophagales bacterium]|nr:excinuclease ABC subunit UvrB [Chitinophagales bacterium]MCB9075842.1 excinuclease ABC subunit UvrB [Chitinophagales bacterium]HMU99192.1 excinuclease ABC subunit UvrB [Chitinophagales bacterium]HMV03662.1 excinuclease ABC subunit UvrB [Chitinophagales bacterium]HMW94124.1 excinuclease ABC subunit UvrB [Chitinophagales bacterium]
MEFKLYSHFSPAGDQPSAIDALTNGITKGEKHQTLLGVTGSGKTFTIANVVEKIQKPTLVLTHNKTLVAQLYAEFKTFFPDNKVEYFVSYYDYYQPEAYVPTTDTYIEKDLAINAEIEKLRLSTTSSLMSGRNDVLVVASVSCIYGLGNPAEYKNQIIRLKIGQTIARNALLFDLVSILYARTTDDFQRGNFRVIGDTVEVFVAYDDYAYRITFWGNDIEALEVFDPKTKHKIETRTEIAIYPANIYIAPKEMLPTIISEIQDELYHQIKYYESLGRFPEAKRLEEKTNFDLEMIRELGYCSGIENYSRYFDRRKAGDRPFCLLDYFPDDFILVIDESHVTLPQVSGMSGGDRSRKQNLVEYGFRLPSALDNRPLNFYEFESLINQVVYVSATPGDYELRQTEGLFVEQVVRPTGLLDPPIEIRPSSNQIDDLIEEIRKRKVKDERILVTTLTKRMAEELAKYLTKLKIACKYIHSDVDTMERVEIIQELRLGEFDVLIGVNLLREGLDIPEVSLVAILDADKEGFLRNTRSLTQTAGRAARNANGLVIFYADKITQSMQQTINETNRRREKQVAYNIKHNITPKTIFKSKEDIIQSASILDIRGDKNKSIQTKETLLIVAEEEKAFMSKDAIKKAIEQTKKAMQKAAQKMDFMEAARLRDEMYKLESML